MCGISDVSRECNTWSRTILTLNLREGNYEMGYKLSPIARNGTNSEVLLLETADNKSITVESTSLLQHLASDFSCRMEYDTTTAKQQGKVVVVGAGPVGCLAALSFARMGWRVEIYELRPGMKLFIKCRYNTYAKCPIRCFFFP